MSHDHLPDRADPGIRVAHIPAGAPNRPGRKIVVRHITVHETANTAAGANAEMHRQFVSGALHGGVQLTSYNYVVDQDEAIELVPIGESSNHAGTTAGNSSGVSIELCVNQGGDWAATLARAEALIVHLYRTVPTLLPVANGLVNHGYWGTGTACPARLRSGMGEGWRALVAAVKTELANGPNVYWDQVGDGIRDAMRAAGDEPTGAEVYAAQVFGADWLSKAPGRLGLYLYDPAVNRIAFLPWL
jgi:N-acetylmuramoyl-L-alanine amidase